MPLENTIRRDLDIRFIDARTLVTEAKLAMGINGYPSKEEQDKLYQKVVDIYNERPEHEKRAMRKLKESLDVAKIPIGSLTQQGDDPTEVESNSSDEDTNNRPSSIRSVLSLGNMIKKLPSAGSFNKLVSVRSCTVAINGSGQNSWSAKSSRHGGGFGHDEHNHNATWNNNGTYSPATTTKPSSKRFGKLLGITTSSKAKRSTSPKSPKRSSDGLAHLSQKDGNRRRSRSPRRHTAPPKSPMPAKLGFKPTTLSAIPLEL